MKNKQRKLFRTRAFKSRTTALVLLAVLVIVLAIYASFAHKAHLNAVSGTIKTTATSVDASSKASSNNTSDATPNQVSSEKSSTGSQGSSSVSLIAPYGSFVSNHMPGQNGSDMKELSQCITSPGATCYIKFTQTGVVKSLPEKTADSSGSILWEWNIEDAGLTSGIWTIEATSKLAGQAKSTTDQLTLEVQ